MRAKDHQPWPHPSMTRKRKDKERTIEPDHRASVTQHDVPKWVTSWPDWFGIHGNVTVVPLEDYQRLETKYSQAKMNLISEIKALIEAQVKHGYTEYTVRYFGALLRELGEGE